MHSFFCNHIGDEKSLAALDKREADHLFKTLRGAAGDTVGLLDGRGTWALGRIQPGKVIEIVQKTVTPEPGQKIHLVCAAPRRVKLDLLLKQAAELGVWAIHIVKCERSVAEPDNVERQQSLLLEACKQSNNPFVPQLLSAVKLADKLVELNKQKIAVVYGSVSNQEFIMPKSVNQVAWLVGPEGGFTPGEEQLINAHEGRGLNLGPYILRLETAAVAGVAVLRKLLLVAVLILLFGCGKGNDANHPLMVKGNQFREDGKYDEAREAYRRMLLAKPESPAAHLAAASLFDENLNLQIEAIYHYSEYLRLAPDAANRTAVTEYIRLSQAKLLKQLKDAEANGEVVNLELEKDPNFQALKRANDDLKKYIFNQQQRLNAALAAAKDAAATPATPAATVSASPSAAPATVTSTASGDRIYVVQAGDTPGKISKKMYGTAQKYQLILDANALKANSNLKIGQELKIPAEKGR